MLGTRFSLDPSVHICYRVLSGWQTLPSTINLSSSRAGLSFPQLFFPIESSHFGYLVLLISRSSRLPGGCTWFPSPHMAQGPVHSVLPQMSLPLTALSHTSTINFLLHYIRTSQDLSFLILSFIQWGPCQNHRTQI